MTTLPTLLVPLDGSSNAMAALPVARGLAHLMDATVTIIHVAREALTPEALLTRMRLSAEDARGLIIDQCTGAPADGIVLAANARHAALIVMCAPGRLDDPSYPFGSVSGNVMRTASCPVVLVPPFRGQYPWILRQLLLPYDGTPTSAAAIAPTADLAARAGAELVVVHIATPGVERPTEPGTFTAPRYLDQPQHEWPMWEREFLGRVQSAGHPANVEKIRLVFAQGEISGVILEFARRNASNLIALAWRGGLEPERAQTMRRVIRDASCPVIVFRVQP